MLFNSMFIYLIFICVFIYLLIYFYSSYAADFTCLNYKNQHFGGGCFCYKKNSSFKYLLSQRSYLTL